MDNQHQTQLRSLDALHDFYVEAVNHAVAQDRMDLVESLAAQYDREASALLAA
jgi:hypothetical protein